MDKVIVNFIPTGMVPTKEDSLYIPVTVQEIVKEVREAVEIGITMVHLHARHPETSKPAYQKELYAEIIKSIREFAPDLIICVSTSGRVENTFETRSDVLQLTGNVKPDMASLTLSSLNFNHQASVNSPEMIIGLAKEMLNKGIKPELEVFDSGMINYAKYLIGKELLKPPYYFNLILGNIACAQTDLLHAGLLVNDLPKGAVFSLGGVGKFQLATNALAIAMGYGVRVGLEDNLWFDEKRTTLATNAELLKRVHQMIALRGFELMTSSEARKLFNLSQQPGIYGIEEYENVSATG